MHARPAAPVRCRRRMRAAGPAIGGVTTGDEGQHALPRRDGDTGRGRHRRVGRRGQHVNAHLCRPVRSVLGLPRRP